MVRTPKYAILFRTHVWDSFVERQFLRLRSMIGNGDLFIVANNTSGKCRIPDNFPVVIFHEADFRDQGLEFGVKVNPMWYNVDYALYFFADRYDKYDYYILFEYDVRGNINFDRLMENICRDGSDLVGLTSKDIFREWYFYRSCSDLYRERDLTKTFLQIGIFSRRAVSLLYQRRLALSEQFRSGSLKYWPHCEAFIPIETRLAGYHYTELSKYLDVRRYSHEPAYLEEDTHMLLENEVVHPVLDRERYIASTIRYEGRPEKFFVPKSIFGKRLRRFPVSTYIFPLFLALWHRIRMLPAGIMGKVFP
ncbi:MULTISPECIES: hypothetical protein [Novacetimonas]|uniref:hypothetical protein n=1 Tax=Novacetimonas TaxID=2919364 RepID=UPI00248E1849|nr:hypothetical protein [Novacetimonas hansenii]